MMFDSGKTSATSAVGTRRAEGGDTRDDYDFCWFLLVFVGFCWFLMVFDVFLREDDDATDEMKCE